MDSAHYVHTDRNLPRDWNHPDHKIIQVDASEALVYYFHSETIEIGPKLHF